MRKHRTLVAAAALATALSLSGCAWESTNSVGSPDTSGEIVGQTSELISELNGGSAAPQIASGEIKATLDETKPLPTTGKIYKQKRRTYTEEQLCKLFDSAPEKTYEDPDPDYYFVIYENDHQQGSMSDSRLGFHSEAGDLFDYVYYHSVHFPEEVDYQGYVSEDGEPDFATRSEAIEKVRTQLQNDFGISPEEWEPMNFHAVKKEAVDLYKDMILKDVNDPEAEASEKSKEYAERVGKVQSADYYYFEMRFYLDDIPLFWGGMFDYGMDIGYSLIGPRGEVVCTEKGIEYLDLWDLTYTDTSAGEPEEAELIGGDKARELILQKYNDIFFEYEVEVCDMELIYLPMPQNDLNVYYESFETRPFYMFYCKRTDVWEGKTYTEDFAEYFDAVTGKNLGATAALWG